MTLPVLSPELPGVGWAIGGLLGEVLGTVVGCTVGWEISRELDFVHDPSLEDLGVSVVCCWPR